jgi:adenosylcobinamide-phosphate synthase
MVSATTVGGAAVGLLVDRAVGEPLVEPHPVALYGRAMGAVEDRLWADRRSRGAVFGALGALVGAGSGAMVRSTAVAVGLAAAGRMLRETAMEVHGILMDADLDRARAALPALVGRDPSGLDASGIAAAVVESVAENTVDAVVAPALWGAALGAPGALAHRAVNTLDAMVGHHSERYERFGWASARADDAMNWLPARATAGLVAAARPGAASAVLRAVREDAGAHPSPNAGVAEAAFAAALGVELGGPLRYGARTEDRPRLGRGPRPGPSDIRRAVELESRVEVVLAATLATAAAGLAWRHR